ncbi:hypothetical protein [Pseudoalteromonas sp. SR41-4]|uniref:hypothetical protein n=1 Tax=Pseudoalteromonas sp. SR41-4 TaxID=2760950 RepID=UPI001603292E|nr:hypothetical protein [Pseudoalteromonas sp. SR41-4]MBB1292168.1 hypothetical protein [Pseudoalteromonas sp. SR41-4]
MAFLSITDFDKALLSQLKTEKERAKYLLQFEITTRITIENLTPKAQAVIADIGLPFVGDNAADVITAARAWLQEKAA